MIARIAVGALALLAVAGCGSGGGGGGSSDGNGSGDGSEPVAWYLAFDPHTTLTGGQATDPGTVVSWEPGSGTLSTVTTVGSPPTAVDGYDRTDAGRFHFSVPSKATVGGIDIGPGDIALNDGGTISIAVAAASVGLPDGADVDALTRRDDGSFLVSLDTHARIGGMSFDDADVLLVDGGTVTIHARDSDLGLGTAADIDGLAVAADGTMFVSLATDGSAAGTAYDHTDIVSVSASAGFGGIDLDTANELSTAADVTALDTNQ